MATATAPISIAQINRTYFVGEGFLDTIQKAVTFAVQNGNMANVIIPQEYTGSDAISAVSGGSATVFIIDQRNGQRQTYAWNGSYVPLNFIQMANVTADTITANDASFDTCLVGNSPVRTFANSGDAGGMEWPPAGIGVSTGTAWGASIPQANIALVNASNTFIPDQTIQGHLHTKNGMSTTGPGFPSAAANQINISNDGTSAFFDCTGPNTTTRGVALFRVVSSDWSLSTNALQINGNGIFVTGNISATGTKPFVMTHPLDSTKLLTHTCLEGPEVALFYRGESETVDGYVVITLPDYFEALTHPEGRTVQLTMIVEDSDGMEALPPSIPFAQLASGRVRDGKFTVYSSKPSTKFCWEVKAVRADVTIDVVSDKEQGWGDSRLEIDTAISEA